MSRRAEEAHGDLESDPLVFGLLHRARASLKATSSPKAAPLIHKIPSTSRAQNGSALFPRSGWICTLLDRTRHMHHICICIPRRTASEVRIAGAIALGDPQSWRPAALSCNPLILLSTMGTIVRARQRMTCRRRTYLLYVASTDGSESPGPLQASLSSTKKTDTRGRYETPPKRSAHRITMPNCPHSALLRSLRDPGS